MLNRSFQLTQNLSSKGHFGVVPHHQDKDVSTNNA